MFCAIGAQAMNGRVALQGLVARAQGDAKQQRAAREKKQSSTALLRERAQEILALEKNDTELGDAELNDLLKWKMGPRGGASKVGAKAAKLAKWLEIKDDDAAEEEAEDDDEPLPFEDELGFLDAQTPRAQADDANDSRAATTQAAASVSVAPNFDVEGLDVAALNALIQVATAEKARLAP